MMSSESDNRHGVILLGLSGERNSRLSGDVIQVSTEIVFDRQGSLDSFRTHNPFVGNFYQIGRIDSGDKYINGTGMRALPYQDMLVGKLGVNGIQHKILLPEFIILNEGGKIRVYAAFSSRSGNILAASLIPNAPQFSPDNFSATWDSSRNGYF